MSEAGMQEALQLLKDLVAIDSVNPRLVPGARGEAEIAEYLRRWLADRGIEAKLEPAAPGRPNVVGHAGPRGGQPALALVGHLDTVGVAAMAEPFTPRERHGRIYGRGAVDMKAGVAAMCAAAAAVVASGERLRRPLLVAGLVDEESDSAGAQAFVRSYSADAAVVTEPTDLRLAIAHKGFIWFDVTTHGRAAHGSLPAEGRDAIRMMGRVLDALDRLDARLAAGREHPLLGRASLHASLITGGQELSSYPAECRLQLERRTLPGEDAAGCEAEMRELLDALGAADRGFRATLATGTYRAAYEIALEAPIVRETARAISAELGRAETCGMSFWTDAAILGEAGIPSVLFGPAGAGLHGAEEYVETESVFACARVLERLIRELCVQA
jgi:acetylornithine deacetylase